MLELPCPAIPRGWWWGGGGVGTSLQGVYRYVQPKVYALFSLSSQKRDSAFDKFWSQIEYAFLHSCFKLGVFFGRSYFIH